MSTPRTVVPWVALPLALAGCADSPETSTSSAALTSITVQSVGPVIPKFEKVQSRKASDPSAQLNFELRLENNGTEPFYLDRVDVSYTGGAPAAVSPQVGRDDLRSFYLLDCDRTGFGPSLTGRLSLDLPSFAWEEFSDVDATSTFTFTTVRARRNESFDSIGLVKVSRFVAAKLDVDQKLGWSTAVSFLGFEDRANALVAADSSGNGNYVSVGGARGINQPFQFAAVQLDVTGAIVPRLGGTPWKVTIPFAGCSAEAMDVERIALSDGRTGFFMAGNAVCAGDQKVAVALLDGDANLLWSGTVDPGVDAAKVGGVTANPANNNELYVVGQSGDHLLAIKMNAGGGLVAGFGAAGISIVDVPAFDRVFAREAKVMSDGRIAIGGSAWRPTGSAYQLMFARLRTTGGLDGTLNSGNGFVMASFPGFTHAYGRDIEIHENETWFTVSGYTETPNRRMVAAAFSASGALRTQFDGDGLLVATVGSASPAYRTSLSGDFITLVGGSDSVLGAVRYHRLDGTLDDPTIISPGAGCALLWPDTGIVPAGASHTTNAWAWDQLPQTTHADLNIVSLPGGAPSVQSWSGGLEGFDDGGHPFPLEAPDDQYTYWHISQAHMITDKHRRAIGFSDVLDRYVNADRYAYDIGMWAWADYDGDGTSAWTSTMAGPNGQPLPGNVNNSDYLAYGRPVRPIKPGRIVRCSAGVPENTPGQKNWAGICDGDGVPCWYYIGGNSFVIEHDDGTFSYYAHLQDDPNESTMCPYPAGGIGVVNPPVEVTTKTVLGILGNSGNSSGPHLHIEHWAPWESGGDPLDPNDAQGDYADARPLMFYDVFGVDDSLTPPQFPAMTSPLPRAAQWGGTILRMYGCSDPAPTTCEDTVPVGGTITEAMQADGDAPPGTHLGLYCPDDEHVNVCVENDDGSSGCQVCDGITPHPGCPCENDEQCGPDMTCWGDTYQLSGVEVDLPGRCYPADDLPAWQCGYDCRANFGEGAWCFNNHPSGEARCMDRLTSEMAATYCWDDGYINSACPADPDAEQSCVEECVCAATGDWDDDVLVNGCISRCQPSTSPAYADECVIECGLDADPSDDCQTLWNYPSEYQCMSGVGVPACQIP